MSCESVPIDSPAEARQNYIAGSCNVYTTHSSGLAAQRSVFETPAEHLILPEIISKEPLGSVVRHGDVNGSILLSGLIMYC